MKIKNIVYLSMVYFLVFNLIGCDAFVRKFTRKRKGETVTREEMVLVPQEYKPTMSKEEQYRQYLLFWKSWQDEIIESLSYSKNHKKQVKSAGEALKNLNNMRAFLNEKKQKQLDVYINQLKALKESIAGDLYGSDIYTNRQKAESIRRTVLREFSYNKVKKDMSP
ncbi:MAG: hypothetical protein PHQ57_03175 [Candidatus Omnitrophica bacterium]|nr:hypothetical protein [Candidatus Omnitrophota bacterium]